MLGCGSGPANTSNTGNTNAASNNPLETTKPAGETVTNDAPTLTPLLKQYCAAKLKKDEAALKNVFSKATIESFEEQMKEDNIKTLVEFLEDEKVTEKLCEVKNERITGDTAIAKIFYDSYPNGVEMYFEKENGQWKMTNKSPTLETDKRSNSNTASAANTNSAK
jgi:ribosome-binding factor A